LEKIGNYDRYVCFVRSVKLAIMVDFRCCGSSKNFQQGEKFLRIFF